MKTVLRFVRHMLDVGNELHLRWALREIDLLHTDVNRIVLRLREIEARRAAA